MTLPAGTRLGSFEVLAPLGAGGMGEVYRAKDLRLGREVALKVLPQELSENADRLARFEQEARSASALNHPNIVTIHEIGRAGDTSYIAMELVDGKTLRELGAPGAMPVRKVLAAAAQAAEGLSKAHGAGIVHRDLKPENLMVSKDGFVKILDFGLAKLTEPESGGISAMPTVGKPETRPGTVMGTVGYMSPEQAGGQPLDFRSDQFSLGSILYELLSGEKAFARKTAAETMSAIIREEPEPLSKLQPSTPLPLRWIVDRCLAKDPEERYASTRDLARDLAGVRDHVSEIGSGGEVLVAARGRPRLLRAALPAVVVAAALAAGYLAARGLAKRSAAPSFHRLTFRPGMVGNARFAPDAQTVVYGATWEGEREIVLYQTRPESPE
ncbi:MAG: serine/threonine-protein kinase, partial [Thermoanaerobaculia bacterium]